MVIQHTKHIKNVINSSRQTEIPHQSLMTEAVGAKGNEVYIQY